MAIGTPTTLGSATGTDTGATRVITTSAAHSAGEEIIVACFHGTSGFTVTSVADSAGNTYTLIGSQFTTAAPTGNTTCTAIYRSAGTNALASGQTITVTWSSSIFSNRAAAALKCSGVDDSIDAGPSTASDTAFPTSAPGSVSVTTTAANCLMIGVHGNSTGTANTPNGSWGEHFDNGGRTLVSQVVTSSGVQQGFDPSPGACYFYTAVVALPAAATATTAIVAPNSMYRNPLIVR